MYMYIYTYIYIHICIFIVMFFKSHFHSHVQLYMYTYIYIYMYVYRNIFQASLVTQKSLFQACFESHFKRPRYVSQKVKKWKIVTWTVINVTFTVIWQSQLYSHQSHFYRHLTNVWVLFTVMSRFSRGISTILWRLQSFATVNQALSGLLRIPTWSHNDAHSISNFTSAHDRYICV